ncbi:PREDICTED: androgen-dependent TFPI-regulating protein-like [Nanorana parkeri]|uniref:androgen-dependent TFPI-regulating protein-like n=1 Tax=Nanorana parkeri TaxID=125878 RepID=UPI0008545F32|nr:PREDICTED: androgen-dependent TFPI-regulating protein-like [Nanorana parkeri]
MATISHLLYHCSIFIWYFSLAYLLLSVSLKDPPAGVFLYGGQWKYLTVLNVVLQTLFYAVSFLTDLLLPIRGIKLVKFVIYCRDLLFSVLAFPASTFVFLSFWALYTYDRQLVYPEGLDKVIPLWLNHAVHTAVFPIAVLEIVTSPHHYPPKRKGLTLLGICSVAYLSWVLWIYIADGNWVYPFLGLLNPFGFIIFLLSSNILAALAYIAGDTLNDLVWAGETQHKKMKM